MQSISSIFLPRAELFTLDQGLAELEPGSHTVTISLVRSVPVPADLGFVGGEVVVGSEDEVRLTFTE